MEPKKPIPSSFRDPSGFLFHHKNSLYRKIHPVYAEHYDHLMKSGLYDELVSNDLLIPHSEEHPRDLSLPDTYKIIKPEFIDFISYPYEWCFSQLKSAAIATLKIQKKALQYGMCLKDASAYNIQFRYGKPLLIDTLSFEKYVKGQPWVAYKQYCQHFLVPLTLMSIVDIRLNRMIQNYIDGIPIDIAARMLPFRTLLKPSTLIHIHLHAKSQKLFADKKISVKGRSLPPASLYGMIDSLESAINNLSWKPAGTEWGNYYAKTNYTSNAFYQKKTFVSDMLKEVQPARVLDLGANTGVFSRLASQMGIPVISTDVDSASVEKNYLDCIANSERNILPLIIDLVNPSPAIGWQNRERFSWHERNAGSMVFALALIHHLAISNNLPLSSLAEYFAEICEFLIIEFIPKSDSQVIKLLSNREDIFTNYTQEVFEKEFRKQFELIISKKTIDSERILYLWKKL